MPIQTARPESVPEKGMSAGQFALALALLVCASYPEVVLGAGTFFHRDFSVFGYPLAAYQRACFWRGELPLWNPLSYCGLPFLAQWNTLSLYPLSLFYLLLPLSWSLGMFCLGHLFLGGMGMFFLARGWTGNSWAAGFSAAAFVFNAFMLNCLMWPNNIAALGWMPWVALAVERAWRQGGRAIPAAALAGGMQMLCGAPEVIALTWVLLAALNFLEVARGSGARWPTARRFLAVAGLVSGLAAAQLLPFLDLLVHSQRGHGVGDGVWAMPIWGWANYLAPLFRERLLPDATYAQPGQYWICSYYLGIGTAALAGLAAWRRQPPRTRLLAGGCVLGLVLALGPRAGLYTALGRALPVLGFMRYPIKFIILPSFAAPLLAAFFIADYLKAAPGGRAAERGRMSKLFGIIAGLLAAVVWAASRFPMKGAAGELALAENCASRLLILGLILAALIGLAEARGQRWITLCGWALVLLPWGDAMTMGARPNPTVTRSVYSLALNRAEFGMAVLPRAGGSRAALDGNGERRLFTLPISNAADRVTYSRLTFYQNMNLLENVPKVNGAYSLYSRELESVLALFYGPPRPPENLMDFLSVQYVNLPGQALAWKERPSHLPWVTGGQRPVFAGAAATLRALAQPSFDPRRQVFLPTEARAAASVLGKSAPNIVLRQFSGERVRLEVEAAASAIIVVAQTFDRNWRAFIDGRPVKLWRANYAFQALKTPAGRHQITLIYRDLRFYFGAGISLATLVFCAGWMFGLPQRAVGAIA